MSSLGIQVDSLTLRSGTAVDVVLARQPACPCYGFPRKRSVLDETRETVLERRCFVS